MAAVGIVSLVMMVMAAACSDGSTSTTTTPASPTTPATLVSTTVDAATSSSPVEVTFILNSTATIVLASVDNASLAGYRLDIGISNADVERRLLEQRLGPASADSGWVPIAESFPCHIYAESRTIWWGDIAFSFGRHRVHSPDDGTDSLEGWSVGVIDGFTVPILGSPAAPRVRVLLDGEVEIGSSAADLYRLVHDSGYMYNMASPPTVGMVWGHSYFPVSVNIENGSVAGFGVSPFECYADTSGF